MLRFLQTFVEIGLWRKGPQDLPASRTLALLVLAAYMAVGFIVVQLFYPGASTAIVFMAVDVLMIGVWLWGVLALFGRRERFIQTITATLGVGVLIALLDMSMRVAQLTFGLGDALAYNWLVIRFVLLALVMGRIFMHALERGLLTGMGLTVAIVYSTDAVARLTLEKLAAG